MKIVSPNRIAYQATDPLIYMQGRSAQKNINIGGEKIHHRSNCTTGACVRDNERVAMVD